MTCSTSAVAVCCSNASRVSVNSRAFSIAMTACAAKFSTSAICLSVERPHFLASGDDLPEQGVISAQRHKEEGPDTCQGDPAGAGDRVRRFPPNQTK